MIRDRPAARWPALLAALILPALAHAQDLEPRLYTNTPVGLNFVIAGYGYQTGDVLTDAALPISDAQVELHSAAIAYVRSFGLLGTSGKCDVVFPYGWVSGSATVMGRQRRREVEGFADPRFRVSVNLLGAPALSVAEFGDYQQDLILGVSLSMWAPIGQYDADRLLNLGVNRWAFKPEIGISKALGPLVLEVAPAVVFFTENPDFFGGRVREQTPIYAVQGHAVYRFGPPLWVAFDTTYYGGGTTTIDGMENRDRQSNLRIGGTVALSLNRHNSIKLYASTNVVTRFGGDFDTVGMAWQYRWGGGL
jgi:hypothetical protein